MKFWLKWILTEIMKWHNIILVKWDWRQIDRVTCMHAKLLQLCLTLCNPVDCCPPASSLHGILQARILEWVAMPSSRGSSWARDWTRVSYCLLLWQVGSLPLVPPGKPCQGNSPHKLIVSGDLLHNKSTPSEC